jgi:ABC transporter substrate binding protein (PQQ-dependent alcohol dehydrogenase system)
VIRVTLAAASMLAATSALSADSLFVKIGYLGRVERMETISLLEQPTSDNGVAGAQLAIEDNNTTGKFLNQSFSLEAARLKGSDDPVAAAIQLADRGVSLILLDLPADMLLKIADVGRARGLLLFNVGAADDQLRQEDCRPDVIHVAPSRSMLADGLAQYLVWKRWRRWLLVVGSHDPDKLYADALRRAAGRFGAKIVQERVFQDTGGARRTDSGLVQIQSQIPPFTQSAPDYEVLIAADESQVFASYLPYRTHDPRPVAGSAGLVPTSWHASLDQWGAIQLQGAGYASVDRGSHDRRGCSAREFSGFQERVRLHERT